MLKSISGNNSRDLCNLINQYQIKREQIIQFVSKSDGSIALFYEERD